MDVSLKPEIVVNISESVKQKPTYKHHSSGTLFADTPCDSPTRNPKHTQIGP